jgi:ABC-type multidrug transport system ATPase subunit
MIEARAVSKRYGDKRAVDDISREVQAGLASGVTALYQQLP